jgi:hypothetical protein
MNTDEHITTAIDNYLSHQQFRDDDACETIGWQKRAWETKDKLLKLQLECRDIDHNLVSWGELNTIDGIILAVGFYQMSMWPHIDGYVWRTMWDKDSTTLPTLGQHWYHYLGERPRNGIRCSVVVLLNDEGVSFLNEITRRVRDAQLKNWWW